MITDPVADAGENHIRRNPGDEVLHVSKTPIARSEKNSRPPAARALGVLPEFEETDPRSRTRDASTTYRRTKALHGGVEQRPSVRPLCQARSKRQHLLKAPVGVEPKYTCRPWEAGEWAFAACTRFPCRCTDRAAADRERRCSASQEAGGKRAHRLEPPTSGNSVKSTSYFSPPPPRSANRATPGARFRTALESGQPILAECLEAHDFGTKRCQLCHGFGHRRMNPWVSAVAALPEPTLSGVMGNSSTGKGISGTHDRDPGRPSFCAESTRQAGGIYPGRAAEPRHRRAPARTKYEGSSSPIAGSRYRPATRPSDCFFSIDSSHAVGGSRTYRTRPSADTAVAKSEQAFAETPWDISPQQGSEPKPGLRAQLDWPTRGTSPGGSPPEHRLPKTASFPKWANSSSGVPDRHNLRCGFMSLPPRRRVALRHKGRDFISVEHVDQLLSEEPRVMLHDRCTTPGMPNRLQITGSPVTVSRVPVERSGGVRSVEHRIITICANPIGDIARVSLTSSSRSPGRPIRKPAAVHRSAAQGRFRKASSTSTGVHAFSEMIELSLGNRFPTPTKTSSSPACATRRRRAGVACLVGPNLAEPTHRRNGSQPDIRTAAHTADLPAGRCHRGKLTWPTSNRPDHPWSTSSTTSSTRRER